MQTRFRIEDPAGAAARREVAPLLHPEQLFFHALGRHPRGADDDEGRGGANGSAPTP